VLTIRAVDINNAKPIVYGLSNFCFYMNSPIGSEQVQGDLTRAERSQQNVDRLGLSHQDNMEALLAAARFDHGRLIDVRLHPVDVGKGTRPLSKLGIPMTPAPDVAREILEKVQRLSHDFATDITIENGTAVIRPAAQTSARTPAP
jgi:poly-gamma-glutamate synthesis protein (capsule biosynthesis protein)